MVRLHHLFPFFLLGVDGQDSSSASTDCQSRINHHRAKYGISPLITERSELHSCVNRQSEYDKQMGAHKSYKRCGSLGSQGQGGGSNCANVIDAFFNERWRCSETAVFGTPYATSNQKDFRQCRRECMQDSSCLSFDIDSDAEEGDKCRYYNEASLTTVKQMDGTLWLGEPGLTTQAPSTVDGWESYSTLEVDGSRAIPMDGKITSFKWFGSNANAVTFYIYRHVTGNTYEMVAKAEASSTVVNQENTLNVNIAVQTGDMIGWTWTGKAAFGFDKTNQGQTRYRAKENTGGPVNIGDQWLFDGGSDYRTYHYAASFTPNDSFTPAPTRNYCAAAKCHGHCGPVMDGGTGTFAWGVYEGFYTLNWRPGPTLPEGKNECPSGIDVVKCWNDEERGILWAYGVGGEDCHSTCSLAGAKPSDLMCDETVAITNGLTEVSEIMENFDNPYNSNDSEEFTCTKGSCWNGVSNKQILIHEYNSDCYVPDKTDRYVCDAKVGNGNCYGQRFNQICPCVAGCSHAAGPSCAPSSNPSAAPISASTEVPSGIPSDSSSTQPSISSAPSASPVSSTTDQPTSDPSEVPSYEPSDVPAEPCVEDSTRKFFLRKNNENKPLIKKCRWLESLEPSKRENICKYTKSHRKFGPAKDVCPVSCNTCKSDCTEKTIDKFHRKMNKDGKTAWRESCGRLARRNAKQIKNICKKWTDSFEGYGPPKEVCRVTCKSCTEE